MMYVLDKDTSTILLSDDMIPAVTATSSSKERTMIYA